MGHGLRTRSVCSVHSRVDRRSKFDAYNGAPRRVPLPAAESASRVLKRSKAPESRIPHSPDPRSQCLGQYSILRIRYLRKTWPTRDDRNPVPTTTVGCLPTATTHAATPRAPARLRHALYRARRVRSTSADCPQHTAQSTDHSAPRRGRVLDACCIASVSETRSDCTVYSLRLRCKLSTYHPTEHLCGSCTCSTVGVALCSCTYLEIRDSRPLTVTLSRGMSRVQSYTYRTDCSTRLHGEVQRHRQVHTHTGVRGLQGWGERSPG